MQKKSMVIWNVCLLALAFFMLAETRIAQAQTGFRNKHKQQPQVYDFSKRFNLKLDKTVAYLDSTELDSIIISTMEPAHIPGLAACIVKDGRIIWTGAYGYADIEKNIPVRDSTIFGLGSVSKTITGTALMQLYDDGRFGLDDDINNYLPFPVKHPLFPDVAITFRMLLTHTSSIKDDLTLYESLYFFGGDSPIRLGDFLRDYLTPGGAYYSATNNFNFLSRPGTKWDYSNVAIALAGYLVEAITGTPFDQYCENNLFAPLGMNETSWFLADLDTTHIARPYHYDGSSYVPYPFYGYPTYPDGQLKTSTLQLGRFLIAFMQKGQIDGIRILDSTTVELMTTVHVQIPESGWSQGFIWVDVNPEGPSIWGHTGGDPGFTTIMFYIPDEKWGAVILTNGDDTDLIFNAFGTINLALREFALSFPTAVEEKKDNPTTPARFSLYENYPNPFNPGTVISYQLSVASDVRLTIFNALGQEIRTLVNGRQSPGQKSVVWDGKNDLGHQVNSGVYFYKLKADDRVQTKKMLLMR
jgi:CubicO group peptidase (beta-lactamase class C family)